MEALDYDTLLFLRKEHPGWRLLCSDHVALIATFLHRTFIRGNQRTIAEPDLTEALEDDLFALRERFDVDAFPRSARDYLDDWASPGKGWLRKFYLRDSDTPHFDLSPATERAIAWLSELKARPFVGTESRLLTLFDLLRQMVTGSTADPEARIRELEKQREAINTEIARIAGGQISLLDDTAMRERFQQFTQMARELLSDFREVEHNFRQLDRSIRERIALWEGSKATLLDEILGKRNAIDDSDQGRSFRAFWDFLMSHRRQEELSTLLEQIFEHPAVRKSHPDTRLKRVHYDWLEAGDHTQRTVADLSRQLRRFLDDQAHLENRRIVDLLRSIESKAIALRESSPPMDSGMTVPGVAADIQLLFERPLYTPPFKPTVADKVLAASGDEVNASALYSVSVVDKAALGDHIRQALQTKRQVTLEELIRLRPLTHGLAEVVAYLESKAATLVIDESIEEELHWETRDDSNTPIRRLARLPRVIFVR